MNFAGPTTYASGTPNVSKAYSKTDKILGVTYLTANRGYTYDDNDNLITEAIYIPTYRWETTYAYNGNDQVSSIKYPQSNRVINYAPDVLGRPTQASGYVTSVSYWPSGQFKQIVYGNGTVSNYGQNSRMWPGSFDTKKGTTATYLNSNYGYDGLGNLKSIADTVDSSYNRTMDYDGINRLVNVAGPWGAGTIAYDGVGNISNQLLGASTLYYSYDTSNRLSSVSGIRAGTYTYDALGNISTGLGSTYTYDRTPNLICVNCANASTKGEYTYDGLNKRVTVTKGGVKSYEVYVSNGNQLIEFVPSQGNKLTEYIYLGSKRVAQIVSP